MFKETIEQESKQNMNKQMSLKRKWNNIIVTEIKYSVDGSNGRLEPTEERKNELQSKAEEIPKQESSVGLELAIFLHCSLPILPEQKH